MGIKLAFVGLAYPSTGAPGNETLNSLDFIYQRLSTMLVFLGLSPCFDLPIDISTYRTRQGVEVDFVVRVAQKIFAIECKASSAIHSSDTLALESLMKRAQTPIQNGFIFHTSTQKTKFGKIWVFDSN